MEQSIDVNSEKSNGDFRLLIHQSSMAMMQQNDKNCAPHQPVQERKTALQNDITFLDEVAEETKAQVPPHMPLSKSPFSSEVADDAQEMNGADPVEIDAQELNDGNK